MNGFEQSFRIKELAQVKYSIYLWNFPKDIVFNMIDKNYNIFDFSKFIWWLIHLIVSLIFAIISDVFLEPVIGKKIEKLFMKS